MRTLILLAFAVVAFGRFASAGTIITMAETADDTRSNEQHFYIDSENIRVSMPDGYLIYHSNDDDILIVNTRSSTYIELSTAKRRYAKLYQNMIYDIKKLAQRPT